ncbi:hypothetical protein J1N35_005589 [Gossypium stocksii]|uniref:Uncharacterized protein n=1 Tax=Gossypium stocksii TaxID=47602 RepID=A0A9D3WD71_9ROSI|nr:hypothetical protein J1N35_005589 [Gossypium stocksii]
MQQPTVAIVGGDVSGKDQGSATPSHRHASLQRCPCRKPKLQWRRKSRLHSVYILGLTEASFNEIHKEPQYHLVIKNKASPTEKKKRAHQKRRAKPRNRLKTTLSKNGKSPPLDGDYFIDKTKEYHERKIEKKIKEESNEMSGIGLQAERPLTRK